MPLADSLYYGTQCLVGAFLEDQPSHLCGVFKTYFASHDLHAQIFFPLKRDSRSSHPLPRFPFGLHHCLWGKMEMVWPSRLRSMVMQVLCQMIYFFAWLIPGCLLPSIPNTAVVSQLPSDLGNKPLILWSHGLSSSPGDHYLLLSQLAVETDAVVVAVTHGDGTADCRPKSYRSITPFFYYTSLTEQPAREPYAAMRAYQLKLRTGELGCAVAEASKILGHQKEPRIVLCGFGFGATTVVHWAGSDVNIVGCLAIDGSFNLMPPGNGDKTTIPREIPNIAFLSILSEEWAQDASQSPPSFITSVVVKQTNHSNFTEIAFCVPKLCVILLRFFGLVHRQKADPRTAYKQMCLRATAFVSSCLDRVLTMTVLGYPDRVYNFSAGPGMLPIEVLQSVQSAMLNYNHTGQSVMEMSHRSKEYIQIYNQAEKDMRDLVGIPDHYRILNLQGGATLQFSSIPLNLLGGPGGDKCDFAVTGQWSEKAYAESKKYGSANCVLDTKKSKYTQIPVQAEWAPIRPDACFFSYCDNETVNGVEFPFTPETDGVPLVADMSSNFMSRAIDVRKHAVIYAGAQKNLGPAGNTVVIVDEKYLDGKAEHPMTPIYCSWAVANGAASMYNTPSCFAIYVMGVYLQYTKEKGGVQYWQDLSDLKSRLLYDTIDNSDGFYSAPVDKSCRSRMNAPFIIRNGDEVLEKKFLAEASKSGLINLAGHRSVGGIRASLYNGVPVEGVESLVNFMKNFQEQNTL